MVLTAAVTADVIAGQPAMIKGVKTITELITFSSLDLRLPFRARSERETQAYGVPHAGRALPCAQLFSRSNSSLIVLDRGTVSAKLTRRMSVLSSVPLLKASNSPDTTASSISAPL